MARISLAHSRLRDGWRFPGEHIELPHLVSKAPYRMADWGIIDFLYDHCHIYYVNLYCAIFYNRGLWICLKISEKHPSGVSTIYAADGVSDDRRETLLKVVVATRHQPQLDAFLCNS